MAAEARVDYFLPSHRGEARTCYRTPEMTTYASGPQVASLPEPQVQYYPRDDKRNMIESRAQYQTWTGPHYQMPAHPSYPSNEVGSPPMYGTVHPMHVQMHAYPPQGVPPMVAPAQPTFAATGQPTPRSRGRNDYGTDSSSSNCTPRDHYGVLEKSQSKKNSKKGGSPRLPVVKIPEALKKQGQPSPALWLNSRGFPLRAGKADCKHYTSKGWCAYGTLCKFNHPDSIPLPTSMPCSMMSSYGPPPPGMNASWVGLQQPSYQWGPWHQQQQQVYPVPPQGACYPSYPYSCGVSSPTISAHSSSQGNSNGSPLSENEKQKDPEALAVYN